MAAEHPRLSVLKALSTHLEGITVADGWDFDLAGAVFRGRTLFGDNDPETYLALLEAPRPDPGALFTTDGLVRSEGWSLLLQGFTRDDAKHPTDPLYPLLANVEARLTQIILTDEIGKPKYPDCFLLPDAQGVPQISGLELLPPVVRPPGGSGNEPTAKACFLLPLRVGLALGVG